MTCIDRDDSISVSSFTCIYIHQEGCTPLHRACEHGWIDSVRFLTSAGANIDAVDKVHSDTDDDALHAACSVL